MIDVKNTLLIIAVLMIAGIIGFYIPYVEYQKQQNTLPVPEKNTGNTSANVQYTDRGFEPAVLTIRAGTSVLWVNGSKKLLWVASDPHPSHTDLPGFDERGTDGTMTVVLPHPQLPMIQDVDAHSGGAPFTYVFKKVGRWGYHNHLNPADRGIVVVE